jgi:hypothetical protein
MASLEKVSRRETEKCVSDQHIRIGHHVSGMEGTGKSRQQPPDGAECEGRKKDGILEEVDLETPGSRKMKRPEEIGKKHQDNEGDDAFFIYLYSEGQGSLIGHDKKPPM